MPLISIALALLTLLPIRGGLFLASALPQQGTARVSANVADYDALKQRAEASYAEKSFGTAHELYVQASRLDLPANERRWVDFRLADTAWRLDAANPGSDATARQAAVSALQELIKKSGDDHDRIWAEANESLGDYDWTHRYANRDQAQHYYAAALDWWEGSDDIPLARHRYLEIVWRMATENRPGWPNQWWTGNSQGIPRNVLVNAVAIAGTPDDLAHARFLLAEQLLAEGQPDSVERGLELLDAVIREGKKTPWYADALFRYAQQLSVRGAVVVLDDGDTSLKLDYPKALELYQRICNEFTSVDRYYNEARSAITEISSPAVSLVSSATFLPGSEQEILLTWRNTKTVELSFTPVDLTRDVAMDGLDTTEWFNTVHNEGRPVARRVTIQTNDLGDHVPGSERVRITPRLEPGAYIAEATSGKIHARQPFLVSSTNVLIHSMAGRIQVYVCDAMSGAPLAGAHVRVFHWRGDTRRYSSMTAEANESGLADFPAGTNDTLGNTIVFASSGAAKQAWESASLWNGRQSSGDGLWRIYAFTDRPAYRPGETVHWKIIARTQRADEWVTPAKRTISYEIVSPRNEKVASGEAQLNAFGSFWADLEVTPAMPLGSYAIRFTNTDKDHTGIGYAQIFSLEEYKLPEFRVSVSTPEEKGKRKLYRVGETVEATIEASYYFGGPVANATVEAVIYQAPYVRYWFPWREYDWYYDDQARYYRGYGSELRRETLKTDAEGRAVKRIETPRDSGEMTYRIEARVTDASRREVRGEGSVRVTKQRYGVVAYPEHYLHRPNEKVTLDFKATDANDQPVRATGTVKIVRRWWEEIWIDPLGREISGRDLERARATSVIFPPPLPPDRHPWTRKFNGYHEENILSTSLATDDKGAATMTFTPAREGYYTAHWTSADRDPSAPADRPVRARDVVNAETSVWIAQNATDLGYHAGGLEIVLDKETFRIGETAPVMIVTPASGRWVVLTTTGDEILDTQVLHLDGTVKLVQIPIGRRHEPNFFIQASSVFDRVLATDSKQVVVPPAEHFVKVDVKPDREQYEPKQQGSVTVTTRDADGKPVAAEVAISVSDESVTAIRTDPAGDPRQFFFSGKRYQALQVAASVQSQRYMRLVADDDGQLIDDRYAGAKKKEAKDHRARDGRYDDLDSVNGAEVNEELRGAAGGVVGYMAFSAPAPRQMAKSVAEAITVTAAAPAVPKPMAMASNVAAGGNEPIEVVVRSDFRSTAFWQPDVLTGADGTAHITLDYPQALTTWRATARAATADSQFGMSSATARTSLPLVVRLESPRFFVAGDRSVVSAVVNNNTSKTMLVSPSIEVEGVVLAGRLIDGKPVTGDGPALEVPPNGEARADWMIAANQAGTAKLRVTGRTANRGDAMEKTFTIYEHGIDKLIARSGKLRGDEALVRLDLPAERRAGSTTLTVQIAPSLAVTMLDALPYLIDYPYGCTEQTMSRFLPAAIVARTLAKSGLTAGDIEGRIFGGIEPEHATATHPQGKKNLRRLDDITAKSMARLYDFQHGDGGWGWWKDGESDTFMTAYVVWGFAVAKEGGLAVREDNVRRAVDWLDAQLAKREGQWHDEAWLLHAAAAWRAAAKGGAPSAPEAKAFDDAWSHRERLTAYSRALLALAAHDFGYAERAKVLVRNLEDGVKLDRTPDQSVLLRGSGGASPAETMATAHWGEDRFWWHWYEGPVETTSFALQALTAIDPQNRLVEPVMNWLVKNRRGAQWNNSRDTAIALLGLNDYLGASGELQGDVAYELSVNGHAIASKSVAAADVLRAPLRYAIDPAIVRDGVNEIRIKRSGGRGTAPLYFSAEARFVSTEEPVKAAGNEIFVRRDYFRMAPHPTLLKGVVYERVALGDGGSMVSGERVEVVVTIETKNDYDYLMLEDLKPAGLEAVALQSGQPLYAQELPASTVTRRFVASAQPVGEKPTVVRRAPGADRTGRTAWIYQELRDRKVALFIDHLPQGIWEIRYTLRAETPGSFHALPLLGQAMYVPEIRANGEEMRLNVTER
ncbi:MAG TPA: MG2 domain-containing protein [Thermoanaerobaculia bacterium]|nr:MG2 domain-containing protein [Thermoanaerobaculia bacterium]